MKATRSTPQPSACFFLFSCEFKWRLSHCNGILDRFFSSSFRRSTKKGEKRKRTMFSDVFFASYSTIVNVFLLSSYLTWLRRTDLTEHCSLLSSTRISLSLLTFFSSCCRSPLYVCFAHFSSLSIISSKDMPHPMRKIVSKCRSPFHGKHRKRHSLATSSPNFRMFLDLISWIFAPETG